MSIYDPNQNLYYPYYPITSDHCCHCNERTCLKCGCSNRRFMPMCMCECHRTIVML